MPFGVNPAGRLFERSPGVFIGTTSGGGPTRGTAGADFVANDTTATFDIFLLDTELGRTVRVSVATDGLTGSGTTLIRYGA